MLRLIGAVHWRSNAPTRSARRSSSSASAVALSKSVTTVTVTDRPGTVTGSLRFEYTRPENRRYLKLSARDRRRGKSLFLRHDQAEGFLGDHADLQGALAEKLLYLRPIKHVFLHQKTQSQQKVGDLQLLLECPGFLFLQKPGSDCRDDLGCLSEAFQSTACFSARAAAGFDHDLPQLRIATQFFQQFSGPVGAFHWSLLDASMPRCDW